MPSPSSGLFDLSGRDIWFFGGAGYLGQACVTQAVAAGAKALCVDLSDRAQKFVAEQKLGERVTAATFDVGQTDGIAAFVETQVALRGVPDGLVVLTYGTSVKSLAATTPADFDLVNHLGITATFTLASAVGQKMADAGRPGSIVLFSSMYGTIAPDPRIYVPPQNPNNIAYGVGKAGIQQMARYFSVHWGPQAIRCNSIAPGTFPFPSQLADKPAFLQNLSAKNPLGRIGRPEEMAGPVLFLLSDASSYVTGHNLAVDGGWTAW